jgi:hypothetical protein
MGIDKHRQKWLSKWMTGFCGVGKMLKIYKHQKHSKCPRCMANDEDTSHVLRCPHNDATALWNKSIETMENWMVNNHRHPELIKLIILGLQTWRNDNLLPLYYDILEPLLKKAYTKQRRLG